MIKVVSGFLLALLTLVIMACTGQQSTPTATPTQQVSGGAELRLPEACTKAMASGQAPVSVKLVGSIYVGWMPYQYAQDKGIFKKWGERCNVAIEFSMAADYVTSINAYVARQADGVTMTNMEALSFPGTSGLDTTVVLMGDYSNGNDAVITRQNVGLCDLKGKPVYLVQLTVSHYLLARGFAEKCPGLTESDVRLENASDANIGPVFLADKSQVAMVTWNPIKLQVLSQDTGTKSVFDSSQIPGEIIDLLGIRTDLLEKHPEVGFAVAGAWYETMQIMTAKDIDREIALQHMAAAAGDTTETYRQQLETTKMFWTPQSAVEFTESPDLKVTMDLVRRFSFDHGMYGEGFKSVDGVGIMFPDGTTLGDPKAVRVRFITRYMSAFK